MNFWWVNQNQTFTYERSGGYMWSPKHNQGGGRNQFYVNMTLVEPGDIVFSFAKQRIPCIGVIQSHGYAATKPHEFGSAGAVWANVGWKVDVAYSDLTRPLKPKTHIELIRPTLPAKYSPLQQTGRGNQGVYLANVPEDMAQVLISLIGREAQVILESAPTLGLSETELADHEANEVQRAIEDDPTIDSTEKDTIIKARKGQGLFRKRLMEVETACRVTGVSNPNHLIAGHIKPWAKCDTNLERLDGNNGLLLAPHIDHLFDKGHISFQDDGTLLLSPLADRRALDQLGLPVEEDLNAGPFNDEQKEYLAFHRDRVLKR